MKGLRLSLGKLSAASVVPLSSLTELEELFLGGAGVEDEGLVVLTDLPSLRRLALRNVSSAGLKRVSGLTSLRRLELYGTAFNENQHLQCLSHLTNLQSLDVTGFNSTDETLAQLKSLRSLKRLRLSPLAYAPLPGISEAGLVHLKAMPSLESVELYGAGRITDEGLGYLAGLPNLQTVIIPNMMCEFTDAGLARLSQLTRLEHLYLRVRGITDWGLLHLQRLPALKKLELWRESLTDAGVNRFRQARPEVEVKIGGEVPKSPEAKPKGGERVL